MHSTEVKLLSIRCWCSLLVNTLFSRGLAGLGTQRSDAAAFVALRFASVSGAQPKYRAASKYFKFAYTSAARDTLHIFSQKRGLTSVSVIEVALATASWWQSQNAADLCAVQRNTSSLSAQDPHVAYLYSFPPLISALQQLSCFSADEEACAARFAELHAEAVSLLSSSEPSREPSCSQAINETFNATSPFLSAQQAMQVNASCAQQTYEAVSLQLLAARTDSACSQKYVSRLLTALVTPTREQVHALWLKHIGNMPRGSPQSEQQFSHLPQLALHHHALLTGTEYPWPNLATMIQAQREYAFLHLAPHCDHRSRLHLASAQALAAAHPDCRLIAQAIQQSNFDFFVASAACTKLVCKQALQSFVRSARNEPMCMMDTRIYAEMDSICHTGDDFQPCLYTLAGIDTYTNLKEEFTTKLWAHGPFTTLLSASVEEISQVIGQHGGMESMLDLACSGACYKQQLLYLDSLQPMTESYGHTAAGAHGLCARSAHYNGMYCLVEERLFNSYPTPSHLLYKTAEGGWHPAPFSPGQVSRELVQTLLDPSVAVPPAIPIELQSNPELALFELLGYSVTDNAVQYACSTCGRHRAASVIAALSAARVFAMHEAKRFSDIAVARGSLLGAMLRCEQERAQQLRESLNPRDLSSMSTSLVALQRVSPGVESLALGTLQAMQIVAFTASRQLWGNAGMRALSLLDDFLCSAFDSAEPKAAPCPELLRRVLQQQLLEVMGPKGLLLPRPCLPENFMECSGLNKLLQPTAGASTSAPPPLCTACGIHLARWVASAHMLFLRETTDEAFTTVTHWVCTSLSSIPWEEVSFVSNGTTVGFQAMHEFCQQRLELVADANRHQASPVEFAAAIERQVDNACSELKDAAASAAANSIAASQGVLRPQSALYLRDLHGIDCSMPMSLSGINAAALPSTAFLRQLERALGDDVLSMTRLDRSHLQLTFVQPLSQATPLSTTADEPSMQRAYKLLVQIHATTPASCKLRRDFLGEALGHWVLGMGTSQRLLQQWQAQGWWSRSMGNGTLHMQVDTGAAQTQPAAVEDDSMVVVWAVVGSAGALLVVASGIFVRAYVSRVKSRRVYTQ